MKNRLVGLGGAERSVAMQLVRKGDVSAAIPILHRLAEASGDPEDRFLLGMMAYLATDFATARFHLEQAYRDFQSLGLTRRAAIVATWLGQMHRDIGEDIVGRAWLTRALHLLEDDEPCVEKGYVLVGLFGVTVESAEELEAGARAALDLARRFADPNLECKALGDSGLALVSMGRIRDGMHRLDEAFTMIAAGECTDPSVSSQVCCGLIGACERCGDLGRAEAWLRFIEERTPREGDGPAIHTFARCWSALGSILRQAGRWQEAETALRMGLARGERSYPVVKRATRAALAELWIGQGRLDEAARLIDPDGDRVEVLAPRARLHLARGQFDLAAAVARQALRRLGGDQLRAAPLLLVLVEAELGCGNAAAAEAAAADLQRASQGAEVPAVAAQAALALGKTVAAKGDLARAAQHYAAGLEALGDGWPLLRAHLHLELARTQASTVPAETIVNAEAALSIYQRLGAPDAALAAGLLQAQGRPVTVAPQPPTALDGLSRREREVLALVAQGLSNPAIAGRLCIAPKTAEHHVSSILTKLGLRNRAEAAAFASGFQFSHKAGATL